MFSSKEVWTFTLDGESHRVESEYMVLTGELSLRLDGSEVKNWPGGVAEGARLSAAHDFDVGGHAVEFTAGLSKFNRYFQLTVDGRPVKQPRTGMKPGEMVLLGLFVLMGLLVLAKVAGWVQ